MNKEQIINQEAYDLGILVRGEDRKLIRRMTSTTADTVNSVLSGRRRAIRGQSKAILKAARTIHEFNKLKTNLL